MAQTGTIRGTLKDSKNNEDLIGATVLIDGTTTGAATDINGFFSISKVPAGKVKLVLNYVGYRKKEIADVTVEADKVTEINALMDDEAQVLQEVKVVGTRQTNTEVSVISEIKASQNIVSGISSQQIARTLDRDAAQVVKRVPGITIVGDRFINIRGLNSRYNNVMLHNAFTPSMETDVKSFSFDIIPSSQIDRLLIFKSPSAELPGEFAGGVVKIFTKNIPDQNSVVFDYGISIRQGTTFGEFLQPEQGKNYWTGFNNGYQSIPKSFPNKNLNFATPAELELAGRALRNNWTTNRTSAMPDQRYALTTSFKFQAGKIRFGNVTAINYSDARTAFDITRKDFNEANNNVQSAIYNYNDAQYNRNIRVGVLHNWSVRLNENHSIDFKNLFNQLSNSSTVNRTGRNFESAFNPDSYSFDQVYRGIYTGQLTGQHKLAAGKTLVDWVVGYNNAYRDQPDYRRYRSDVDESNGQRTLYVPVGTAAAFFLGRFSSTMRENALTGGINLTQKVVLKNAKEIEFKVGTYYEAKERDFKGRNIGYVRTSRTKPEILGGNITQLFQPQNINNTDGIRIDEQTNNSDSYNASNDLLAFYGSANVPLSKKINMIAGVRYEANTQKLNSATINGDPVNVSFPVNKLLPSLNLTYNFSEKSLLRAAYGRTLNRPEFRELAPFAFYDFDYNIVYKGNPEVQTANVDNFDLRYEWYPTPNEVVSIAGFYKYFTNPIEVIVIPGAGSGGAKTFTFANAQSSVSSGLELEIRKGLASLGASPLFQKTSLLFNAALIFSRVNLGTLGLGQSDDRPLQGQSPYIINTGINYNDTKKDFQVNLLYNVIGRRIFAAGFEGYPDIYEMPRNVFDVTFSKALGSRWIAKGGVTDILNQTNLLLQNGNGDKKFDRKNDQLIQTFQPGRMIQLGFSYRIL
ncbi:MAG: TonB-dependent receptor [Runella slithyformis]|nr:MAG: TonB-dependent receptor [Runella slithyformis]TAE98737.1 MAG: TonB-dependent receptor [Runella slithyformis]TAF79561.1 MAG: TonB-dependent receptor [Runella slithyformis]